MALKGPARAPAQATPGSKSADNCISPIWTFQLVIVAFFQ